MDLVAKALEQHADEIAKVRAHRALRLEHEISELNAELKKAEDELDISKSAVRRRALFKAQIGQVFMCPLCWIDDEQSSPLTLTGYAGGEDPSEMRCIVCNEIFEVPS